MIAESGIREPNLIGVPYMTIHRLFPMLMYTVQINQIYTAIVDEVVHYEKESKNSTECPKDYMQGGIAFFAAVCIIWAATVCSVIRHYINDLHKFKQANPNREIKLHRRRLLYFLFVLVLYTPLYIALDNAWTWTCVARCQLQEVCIDSELGVCIYEIVRGGFLGAILIFTTLNLGSLYCSNWCEKSHRTCMEDEIDGPVTRQQRSADQDGEMIALLSQQRSADRMHIV